MFWWIYSPTFNPTLHWPLSGAVAQDIHPDLLAKAGNAQTEARVLREVASYGRQIGALSDVILALADKGSDAAVRARGEKALAQLRTWSAEIDARKPGHAPVPDDVDEARALLQALVTRHPELGAR